MIFHPHYEGVTIHRREDVDITCTGDPVVTGYREQTGNGFWRVPIEAPKGETKEQRTQSAPRVNKSTSQPPKKLSAIERYLLSKSSPTISRDVVSQATEIAHNVYELPSLKQGIRWMHAACGYPVQSTWIKAIRNENYAGWPLLTVKNVNKHYPKTDATPMGHLNQTRANVRSTKPKPVPLPYAVSRCRRCWASPLPQVRTTETKLPPRKMVRPLKLAAQELFVDCCNM